MKTFHNFLIGVFTASTIFAAGLQAAGKSALPLLSLRATSKAESLAGALTAAGDDLSALSINPASMSRLKFPEAIFSQAVLFEDARFSYAAYAQPTKFGVPSFEYMNLSYGDFDRVDRDGANTGAQSPKETLFGFGWSTKLKSVAAGAAVRVFKSDLGAASASGISMNFGALYKTPMRGLSAGLAVNNLGSSARYAAESFSQPRAVRLGLGFSTGEFLALSSKARFAVDGVMPNDGKVHVNLGSEILFADLISFQAGYAGEEDLEKRFRFGLGLSLDAIALNYSASPMGDLGTSHRISIRMRFGPGIWNLMSILSGEQAVQENLLIAAERQEAGDHAKAALYARRALKKRPQNIEAQEIIRRIERKERAKMGAQIYGEAVALIRLGMFRDSEEKIKQAIELDPENQNYQSIYETVKAQVERGQKSETDHLLAQIRESQAPPAPVQPTMSLPIPEPSAPPRKPAPKAGETVRAPEPVNRELDADSKAEYQRALALIQERRLEEALGILRLVNEKNRSNQESALKLSECLKAHGVKLFAKGKYEDSHAHFKEAQALNPRDPSLKKFLANVEQIMEALNLQPSVAAYLKSRK